MKKISGGFTLIELLVVIAIIGLLASIILAALKGARNKGTASAVTQQMEQLRNASALFSAGGGQFLASNSDKQVDMNCGNAISNLQAIPAESGSLYLQSNFTRQLDAALNSIGAVAPAGRIHAYCNFTDTTWVVVVPVTTTNLGADTGLPTWCVDSNNNSFQSGHSVNDYINLLHQVCVL